MVWLFLSDCIYALLHLGSCDNANMCANECIWNFSIHGALEIGATLKLLGTWCGEVLETLSQITTEKQFQYQWCVTETKFRHSRSQTLVKRLVPFVWCFLSSCPNLARDHSPKLASAAKAVEARRIFTSTSFETSTNLTNWYKLMGKHKCVQNVSEPLG